MKQSAGGSGKDVTVEVATSGHGDHYDPEERVVRLTKEKLNGRSLTAVTVAAHEVGHACQDAAGYRPLPMLREGGHLLHGDERHARRL